MSLEQELELSMWDVVRCIYPGSSIFTLVVDLLHYHCEDDSDRPQYARPVGRSKRTGGAHDAFCLLEAHS